MPGLLQVLTREQSLQRSEAQVQERFDRVTGAASAADQYSRFLCRLDSYVSSCWDAARNAKEQFVQPKMLEDLRQREGEYDADKLAAIRAQGGSEIYMMLTNVKCRAAEGWLRDILLPAGERPFSVRPTPVPDLSEDIKATIYANTMTELQEAIAAGLYPTQQQVYARARELYDDSLRRLKEDAQIKAQRSEDCIDDILVEGAWYDALEDMIADLVALPAGIIKGPVIRKKARLTWDVDPATGKATPRAADELVPMFYSPSPLDIYPAPDSKGVEDGYLFERIPLRRSSLHAMKGVPGYDSERIDAALDEYQRSGVKLWLTGEQERRNLEQARNWETTPDNSIDALEFHGSIRGEWLLEWGVDAAQVPDPTAEYEVVALKVGRFVVRVAINADPLKRRPYVMASFDRIKGSFWGNGLPRLIRDLQGMCNACARALANNMGLASGPMVEVEVDRLAEGEDPTKMYPWRLFQTKASRTTPSPAVRFHNPNPIVEPLLRVYTYFSTLADNYSGIPSYEQGINQTSGAAGTASGLSMLMGAASRQIKRIVSAIDRMIVGTVERVHTHVMLYVDKPEVKGDINIEARGASSLMVKEQQQVRRMEFLRNTANPIDAPIIGPKGRAAMLREALQSMDINPDDVLPPEDEMRAQMMQQAMQAAMQPQPGAPGPQALDPAGNPVAGQDARLV